MQRNHVILELVSPADGTAVSELVSAQGMGGEELSLSISLANLDLFILLVNPCSQTSLLQFSIQANSSVP